MLTWVPFPDIGVRHIELLAKSLHAAPEPARMSVEYLIRELHQRRMRLFEYTGGLIVVHKDDKRLIIDALACEKLGQAWLLEKALQKLAADWQCDTIKTTVFDERLARAIRKLGGRVEAIDLILPVEREDEQR